MGYRQWLDMDFITINKVVVLIVR